MAAEPDIVTLEAKDITCPLCREYFREPKVLPTCLHYYCRECIQNLAEKSGEGRPFACPECHKDVNLPENDAGRLPTLHFVDHMKRVHDTVTSARSNSEIVCGLCSPDHQAPPPALAFCCDCAEYICDFCEESHQRRQKAYKDHKVVKLEELRSNPRLSLLIKKRPSDSCKCPDHRDKVLEYYCFRCNRLICQPCINLQHKDHECDTIDNCGPEYEKSVRDRESRLKTNRTEINDSIEEVERVKSKITDQVVNTEEKVNRAFTKVMEVVQTHRQELIDAVHQKEREKLNALESQLGELRSASSRIHDVTAFVDRCLENGSNTEITALQARMTADIQREIKTFESLTLKPAAAADIDVTLLCVEKIEEFLCENAALYFPQADVSKCTVEGDGIHVAETKSIAKFTIHTAYCNGLPCKEPQDVRVEIKSLVDQSNLQSTIDARDNGTYDVSYRPATRGRHEVSVYVNNRPLPGCPFHMYAETPPTQLCEPIRHITGLQTPYGASLTCTGRLLVSESVSHAGKIAIVRTDASGTTVDRPDQINLTHPTGIVVDEEESVYVVDQEENCITKYDRNWTSCASTGKDDLDRPGRITVSRQGELFVCDRANGRVLVFDRDLQHSRIFGNPEDVDRPVGIAFDEDGNVYITDLHLHRISKFSLDGNLLGTIGRSGNNPGELHSPRGITIRKNYIYVTERDNHRVSVFQTNGKFVTVFGTIAELHDPGSIVIDDDGFVYVCDDDENCIVVF